MIDTGRVLGGALRLLRRRTVLGLGMVVALVGLVYAALDIILTTNNPNYLNDLAQSLSTDLPPDFPAWLAAGVLLVLVGGLWSEGGLILAAGRRAGGETVQPARRGGSALRRLPVLLLAGARVWWPAALGLALTLAPAVYWAVVSQEPSPGWGLAVLGSLCLGGGVFLVAWLLLWPQQRLANCAVLLDGQGPGAAVVTARWLFWGRFGAVFGVWFALLLLNALLLLVSGLLAGLAAVLVYGLWTALNGVPENAALLVTALVALVLAGLVLLWDGAVSAFNLNTWVLTYLALRGGRALPADLTTPLDSGQILGRQRATDFE